MENERNTKSCVLVVSLSIAACMAFFAVVQGNVSIQAEASSTKYIYFKNSDGQACRSNQESYFVEIECDGKTCETNKGSSVVDTECTE